SAALGGTGGVGIAGGVYHRNGNLLVLSSTFTRDVGFGREIYSLGDGAAASAVLNNTLVGQTDTSALDFIATTANGGSTGTAGVGNLIRTQLGFAGSIVSTADPLLGPLTDNGGPTPTFPPQ